MGMRGMPVAGIGKAPPRGETAVGLVDELQAYIKMDTAKGMQINEQKFPDAPDWALALFNQIRELQTDHLATKLALLKHRVLRPHELVEAKAEMLAAAEAQMQSYIQQLGREMAARPPVAQQNPADPRRTPQP